MRVDGPQFVSNAGEIPDLVKGPGKYIASYKRSEAFGEFENTSYLPAAGRLFTGFPDGLMLMAVHPWPASILGSGPAQSIHRHCLLVDLTSNPSRSYVWKWRSSSENLETLFPTVAQ